MYTAGKLLLLLYYHCFVVVNTYSLVYKFESLKLKIQQQVTVHGLSLTKKYLKYYPNLPYTEPHHPSHSVQPPSPSPCSAITPFSHVNLYLPMSPLCRSRQRTASPQRGQQSLVRTTQQNLSPPPVRSGGRAHCEPGTTTGQSLCTLDRWAEMRELGMWCGRKGVERKSLELRCMNVEQELADVMIYTIR